MTGLVALNFILWHKPTSWWAVKAPCNLQVLDLQIYAAMWLQWQESSHSDFSDATCLNRVTPA